MKNFGILTKKFLFENFILLFLVSKFFVLFSFFISIFFNLKNNKLFFFSKILKIYKVCLVLIVLLYAINFLNNVSLVNHIKFSLNLLLILVSVSISLFFYKNKEIYKNSLFYLNLFNLFVILDVFLFRMANFSILTNWNNFIFPDAIRYSGILFEEKILGFYLLCCMPLILLFKNHYSSIYKNEFIFIIVLILYVFAIYFTGERRSFLLSLVCFVLIVYNLNVVSNIKRKILAFFVVFLISVSVIYLITNNLDKNKYIYDLNFRMLNKTIETIKTLPLLFKNKEKYEEYILNKDIGNWFLLYDSATRIFTKDTKTIFIGIGFKNYKSKCKENKKLICSTHPHHYLIEIIISFGLIGSTILLFYLYKITKYFYLKRKYLKEYIIFLIIFFFPFFPSGSIFSINLLSNLVVFSSFFVANQFILENSLKKNV